MSAGKGITIGIASETKAFKDGIATGVIKPVDDAVAKLDELGKAGGPAKLDQTLTKAQTSSKVLARETAKTADAIESDYKAAYAAASEAEITHLDGATTRLTHFRESAKGNLKAIAQSFDGTLEGLASSVEGAVGNTAIALGGAAGAAVAGLGVVGSVIGNTILKQVEADAKASEERIKTMYENFIQSGQDYLTEAQTLDATSAIIGDTTKLADATARAKLLGVTIQEELVAEVTSSTQRNELTQKAIDLADQLNGVLGKNRDPERIYAAEALVGYYKQLNTEQEAATRGAAIQLAVQQQLTGEAKGNTEELRLQRAELAKTPATVTTRLVVDNSALTAALSVSPVLRVAVEAYTRTGSRVI